MMNNFINNNKIMKYIYLYWSLLILLIIFSILNIREVKVIKELHFSHDKKYVSRDDNDLDSNEYNKSIFSRKNC